MKTMSQYASKEDLIADLQHQLALAQADNESLRNQLAECKKDAERLDYLSNHDLTYRVLIQSQPSGNYVFDSCEVYKLREAIDQAMSEKG